MTNSSCCNALPTQAHAEDRVVIYYYDQGWVPVKYCTLVKAVALQRRAGANEQGLFIFPVEAAPARLPSLTGRMVNPRAYEG